MPPRAIHGAHFATAFDQPSLRRSCEHFLHVRICVQTSATARVAFDPLVLHFHRRATQVVRNHIAGTHIDTEGLGVPKRNAAVCHFSNRGHYEMDAHRSTSRVIMVLGSASHRLSLASLGGKDPYNDCGRWRHVMRHAEDGIPLTVAIYSGEGPRICISSLVDPISRCSSVRGGRLAGTLPAVSALKVLRHDNVPCSLSGPVSALVLSFHGAELV